jgi:hypothetical protein
MKKLIITILAVCIVFCGFAFLILFEASIDKTFKWWASFSRDNPTLPYSPYRIRRADSAYLRIEDANQVKFIDKNLFWKGTGAIALPELTKSGKLVNLILKNGGSGYSKDVKAIVTGSMGNEFKIDNVKVVDGEIVSLNISKTSNWHSTPIAFWGDENLPFSGTTEKLFPNNQIMIQKQFLSGKLHGKWEMFKSNGLKVFSKDYVDGKKHGTHIFWFDEPQQPDGYVYIKDKKKSQGTLWLEVNEKAKEKFGREYGNAESNAYVMNLFKQKQGYQQVRLLEHWDNNQKHGLFEGFDRFGNKTFKDEFKYGLRIKHRTFDKTKTISFDRKKEGS